MAAAIQMYRDLLNFEQLLHLLVYQPETCRDTSKWGYLHCVKVLSEESLIIFLMTSLQTKNWVAFYFTDDQHGEFFDSYGLPPHRYTKYFEDFINRNAA